MEFPLFSQNDFPLNEIPTAGLIAAAMLVLIAILLVMALAIQTAIRATNFGSVARSKILAAAFSQLSDGVLVFVILWWLDFNLLLAAAISLFVMVAAGFLPLKAFFQSDWAKAFNLWGTTALMQLILIPLVTVALAGSFLYFFKNLYPLLF